jgi:TolB-like protein
MLAMLLVPGLAFAQDTRPGVAILPFGNGGSYGQDKEDFEALTGGLQQLLLVELALNSGMRLVERDRLNTLLAEQNLAVDGRVDEGTAAQVGKLVGAKYVVIGSFIDWYGDMTLNARIVNSETSELVRATRTRGDREKTLSLVVELADAITKDLSLPPLPRQVQQERQGKAERIPHEAVRLYTKALLYADRGDRDRAIQLFSQITKDFPEYEEAGVQLRQLQARS